MVAGEVHGLAGRAREGVSEIRVHIEAARADTRSGAHCVDSAVANLGRVRGALGLLQSAVIEIAAAVREQASGIEQVNQAVPDLDGLTEQNAALAEESAAMATGMREQAESPASLLAALRIGDELAEGVERSHADDAAAPQAALA